MGTPFDVPRFEQMLTTRWLGRKIHVFNELPSTNTYMKEQGHHCRNTPDSMPDGSLVLAEFQSAGRGQYDRNWQTEPYQNLTFSFCFKPCQLKRLQTMTLIVAVACAEALELIIQQPIHIKWPNDLYHGNEKFGGILIESALIGDKVDNLVVGIGINVHQQHFDPALKHATSLQRIVQQSAGTSRNGQHPLTREVLLAHLCNKLEQYLDDWDSGRPLPRIQAHKRLVGYGHYGTLEINDKTDDELVKFMGIDEDGFPTFVTWDGDIRRYRYEQIRFKPETIPNQ